MITIVIDQIDSSGNVNRKFTRFTETSNLASSMQRIALSYNLAHTRVTVNDVLVDPASY